MTRLGQKALLVRSGVAIAAGMALFSVANHAEFRSKTCTVSGF